ncbi:MULTISPECIES: NAD(P)/FAD-dependent oxidoreductase [unclassified Halomonas]|uniref:NAD(P)/FAD-dependent oxidoreductase n=1 Tax=unclassified Halomonas TaxID=2609666 RepID=UPI0007F04EFB|nr:MULTISPECIES: FAD/NAD(P)-binding oxidoreductase [unclassified Halomonas]SBR51563.1 sulfide:quinone oxidoreductase [Halomonas sp. HL-93]SNY97408.1 sulfide:quinone oxidoreductase [Halomonas sp. hl-4]
MQKLLLLSRRDLLKVGSGMGFGCLLPAGMTSASTLHTQAHVVILGGGASGIAMASRLTRRLRGGKITLVEPRETHHYQPGWTMVASGVWNAGKTMRPNADFMPRGVNWVREIAVSVDADNKRIGLASGSTIEYDFLIVATGIQLNYGLIDGMSPELIGQHGIGSVYASIEGASRTNQTIESWLASGQGKGIFTAAPTPVKCAGAPLKMTFTTLSRLEESGRRERFAVEYMAPGTDLFSQPWVDEFVKQRFDEQGVKRRHHYRLSAIDPQAKQAEFAFVGPESEFTSHHELREAEFKRDNLPTVITDYDFIHVVPPMSAHDFIKNSALIAQDGPFRGEWLDVDIHTMQHNRYPEVFGIGDVIGAPINKTAASVKAQAPVVEENLLSVMQGNLPSARHTGYTSCPMITGIGKAMLVEFGYADDFAFMPSFPFIDPKDESWVTWVMKDRMLQPAYYAVLEGQA